MLEVWLWIQSMGGRPLWREVDAALVEIVDAGLRIGNRRARFGPGEPDFQLGKRHAIDDDRLKIRPPDPGVPRPLPASNASI